MIFSLTWIFLNYAPYLQSMPQLPVPHIVDSLASTLNPAILERIYVEHTLQHPTPFNIHQLLHDGKGSIDLVLSSENPETRKNFVDVFTQLLLSYDPSISIINKILEYPYLVKWDSSENDQGKKYVLDLNGLNAICKKIFVGNIRLSIGLKPTGAIVRFARFLNQNLPMLIKKSNKETASEIINHFLNWASLNGFPSDLSVEGIENVLDSNTLQTIVIGAARKGKADLLNFSLNIANKKDGLSSSLYFDALQGSLSSPSPSSIRLLLAKDAFAKLTSSEKLTIFISSAGKMKSIFDLVLEKMVGGLSSNTIFMAILQSIEHAQDQNMLLMLNLDQSKQIGSLLKSVILDRIVRSRRYISIKMIRILAQMDWFVISLQNHDINDLIAALCSFKEWNLIENLVYDSRLSDRFSVMSFSHVFYSLVQADENPRAIKMLDHPIIRGKISPYELSRVFFESPGRDNYQWIEIILSRPYHSQRIYPKYAFPVLEKAMKEGKERIIILFVHDRILLNAMPKDDVIFVANRLARKVGHEGLGRLLLLTIGEPAIPRSRWQLFGKGPLLKGIKIKNEE